MRASHAIGVVVLVNLGFGSGSYAGDRDVESQPAWPETRRPDAPAALASAAQEPFQAMRGLYATASKGVVKVIAQPRIGRAVVGSGFFVSSSGLIATDWRVIASPHLSAVAIQIEDVIVGVSVLAIDDKAGVAILRPMEAMTIPHVFSGRGGQGPQAGERVFSVGYSSPARLSFSVGVVGGPRSAGEVAAVLGKGTKLDHGYRYIQADSAIDGGNIGGPLLDDKGKVLGMCAMRRPGGPDGFSIEWKAIADLMSNTAKARAMDMGEVQKRAAAVRDDPAPFAPAPTAAMDIIRAFNSNRRQAYCSRCGGKGKITVTETQTRRVTKSFMISGRIERRSVLTDVDVDVERPCPLCRGRLVNDDPKAAGEAVGKMAQALIWAELDDPAAVRPYWEGMRLLGELAFLDRTFGADVNQAAAQMLSAPQKNVGNPVAFSGHVADVRAANKGAFLLVVLGNADRCVAVVCPGDVTDLAGRYCQIAGIVYGSDGSLPLVCAASVEVVHKVDPEYRAKHPAPLPPELAKMAAGRLMSPAPDDTREPAPAEQALARAQMYLQNNMRTKAVDILKELIKDYPKSEQAAAALELLETLAPDEYPPKKKR
jgi:S1-C subfamily serine protease